MTVDSSTSAEPRSPDPSGDTSSRFPLATVQASSTGRLLTGSKMWWVTLICLALAIFLAWTSMPDTGPQITIRFPEGHGLKTGDSVRYLGIEVGTVAGIRLSPQMSEVEVNVVLTTGGAGLNREGTRFWIVRPQFNLTGVSGLETAVGAKYISVSPGAAEGTTKFEFEGLAAAPPDERIENGLDLILQSDELHGINSGAPVTWRGVTVGTVLSADLSPDARHVNVSIRIDSMYRRLVKPGSRFWATSGFAFSVGLSGLQLNAQSLTTIARGGVSFLTPDASSDDGDVRAGDMFVLVAEPDPEWQDPSAAAPLIDFQPPETVTVLGSRRTSLFGIPRTKEFTWTGILVADGKETFLYTGVMPVADEDATDLVLTEFALQSASDSVKFSDIRMAACSVTSSGVIRIPLAAGKLPTSSTTVGSMTTPEDCLVVRSGSKDGVPVPVTRPVDRSQLTVQENYWTVTDSDSNYDEWHGAPVVSAATGNVIGLLIVGEEGPVVAPLSN